jgi:alcohol dehydrogenase (cytochrome c)
MISKNVIATLIAGLLAGCTYHPPVYPITQTQFTLSDRDASQAGQAPPVADRVDSARIAAARSEPQNWLTYYGAYDGQRFSALDQIDAGNVRSLRPAWIFQAGVIGPIASPATYALEAAPLVVDGVMYFSGWDGYVWALDAASGQILWRFRQAIPFDVQRQSRRCRRAGQSLLRQPEWSPDRP